MEPTGNRARNPDMVYYPDDHPKRGQVRPRDEWEQDATTIVNPDNIQRDAANLPKDVIKRTLGTLLTHGLSVAELAELSPEDRERAKELCDLGARFAVKEGVLVVEDDVVLHKPVLVEEATPPELEARLAEQEQRKAALERELEQLPEVPMGIPAIGTSPVLRETTEPAPPPVTPSPFPDDVNKLRERIAEFGFRKKHGDVEAISSLEQIAVQEYSRDGGARPNIIRRLSAYGIKKPSQDVFDAAKGPGTD